MLVPFFLVRVRTLLTLHKQQFYTHCNYNSLTLSLGVCDCYAVCPPSIFRFIKLTSFPQKTSRAFTLSSVLSSSENFTTLQQYKRDGKAQFSRIFSHGTMSQSELSFFLRIMACIKQLSCFAPDPIGNFAADFSTRKQFNLLYLNFI